MLRRVSAITAVAACHDEVKMEWKPMPTNIYTMVPFAWVRCLFFIGSMILYTSDVVRSGLGIHKVTSFGRKHVGIDTYSSFGPFSYPVQTIRKESQVNGSEYVGFAEDGAGGIGSRIDHVRIWPYKFDTLSVGPRALAMELGVKEYPACLMKTFDRCRFEYLTLKDVFAMVDGLMQQINKLFDRHSYDVLAFAVQHQWVDTVEETLFSYLRDDNYIRYYTLQSYRRNATRGRTPVELLPICPLISDQYDRPSFCGTIKWPVLQKKNTTSVEIKIDDHIAVRFARFQAEHPDLDTDMQVLTARNLQWIENSASVYYTRDIEEVVVFTRGRSCDSRHQLCETVVVDDYRYERSILRTNVEEMFGLVAGLRGTAQVYVWLRVSMLVIGVSLSTWYETRTCSVSTLSVLHESCLNLLKVPSHVVVYGTVLPVVLYAAAHLVDCYLYHLIVQENLATTMGKNTLLNARADIGYGTLKMRNIWLIGFVCILIVEYRTHYCDREQMWRHRMGIMGIRGSVISALSFMTLFFPVKFPSLRQIDVLSFMWRDAAVTTDGVWPLFRMDYSTATTGPFLEVRCFLLAAISFMVLLVFIRVVSRMTRYRLPLVTAHSTLIPYSAGTLWSTFALTGYWKTKTPHLDRRTNVIPTTTSNARSIHWDLQTTGIPFHVRGLRVEARSPQMWALIRLMNVAMMTDPMVFVRLRFIGVKLFLYRLKPKSEVTEAGSRPHAIAGATAVDGPEVTYFLPDRIETLYETNQLVLDVRFELVDIVSSKDLSWNQLIMCG